MSPLLGSVMQEVSPFMGAVRKKLLTAGYEKLLTTESQ